MNSQFTITLIGSEVPQDAILALRQLSTQKTEQNRIMELGQTTCLSSGEKLAIQAYRVEFNLPIQTNTDHLKQALAAYSEEWQIDAVLQADTEEKIGLACFDMDSTLIKAEVIDLLAEHAGVEEQVSSITERAMQGELDFKQSFSERMKLLENSDASVMSGIAKSLPIMDGAERLFKNLKKHNIYTAILSGGFDYFAKHLQQKFEINSVLANTLEITSGRLSGRAITPIIDAEQKKNELIKLTQERNLRPTMTMAVGDGANDIEMLNCAGLGVAYKAKPIVQSQASAALNYNSLDALLFLIGFNEKDITA